MTSIASKKPTSTDESAAGMLSRLARGLFGTFAPGNTAAVEGPPAPDPRLVPWAAKIKSAADALAQVPGGSHVFVGTACGTPRELVAALEEMRSPPADLEFVHFLLGGAVPHDEQGRATTRFQHRTFFVGSEMRAAVRQGLAEYVPMSVVRVPRLIENGRIRVIAEANPAMPRTMGDSMLQIGLGRVTKAALKYLADRKDLGIHSDVITDAIIPLLENGILTGQACADQLDGEFYGGIAAQGEFLRGASRSPGAGRSSALRRPPTVAPRRGSR